MEEDATLTTLDRLDVQTLSERVSERLRNSILEGKLRSGDLLVERVIADQLGVSRTAIREALLRLEKERLVQRRRNKEARVISLTMKEVNESNEIRINLESLAFSKAHHFLTPQVLQLAQDVIGKMDDAIGERDYRTYSNSDLQFHRLFWELAGNETLLKLLVNLCTRLFAFRLVDLQNVPFQFPEGPNNHYELLEAVQDGGEGKIRTAFHRHIRNTWYPVVSAGEKAR